MKRLTFDDVLIEPQFSDINSRKEVDPSIEFCGDKYSIPLVPSNMDTITGVDMALALDEYGAPSCLHRFKSIEDNVREFKEIVRQHPVRNLPWVSIGIGKLELDRASALYSAGAKIFVLDVAHGAQLQVVNQFKQLQEAIPDSHIIVGNFATAKSVKEFLSRVNKAPAAIKVGLGNGSKCKTRLQTGIGVPQLYAVQDCAYLGIPVICDGGLNSFGDAAKALAAGASMVMSGSFFAGTAETPAAIANRRWAEKEGKGISEVVNDLVRTTGVVYRGSASKESYEAQGKTASWRAPEGVSKEVPYKGPVADVLQEFEGALRSSMTYVGARNLKEFREKASFIQVSDSTAKENGIR